MGVDGTLDIDWEGTQRQVETERATRRQVAADPRTPERATQVGQTAQDAYWMPAGYHLAAAIAGMPRFLVGDIGVKYAMQASGFQANLPELQAKIAKQRQDMQAQGKAEAEIVEATTRLAYQEWDYESTVAGQQYDRATDQEKKKGGGGFFNKVGDLAGSAAHLAGNVVKPVGRVAAEGVDIVVPERAENAIGSALQSNVVQGTARTAFSAMEAPYQEIVGQARNVAAYAKNAATQGFNQGGGSVGQRAVAANQGIDFTRSQSDFGVAVGDLAQGQTKWSEFFLGAQRERAKLDANGQPVRDEAGNIVMEKYSPALGTGFFPDKSAAAPQEAAQRARDVYSINGEAWTPGRMAAAMIVEPGTAPYNIISGLTDAGVSWWFDPTNKAFDVIAEGRKARDAFELYGLIPGHRYTNLTEVADAYLSSREGVQKLAGFAEEGDWTKIWRRFDRQIDPDLAIRIANEDTVDGVRAVLRPAIGVELDSRKAIPQLGTVADKLGGATWRKWKDNARFLGDVPIFETYIDDHIGTLKALDDSMLNANVPVHIRDEVLAEVGRGMQDPRNATVTAQALKGVERAMSASLQGYGVEPRIADSLTSIISRSYDEMHRFAQTEIGENMQVPFLNIGGKPVELAGPHLLSEQMARKIELPNPRDIKRSASHLNALWTNQLWTSSVDGLQAVQAAWKKWVLLRSAYVVRVVADEQIRMGADGYASMLDHPGTWLAYVAGEEDSKLASFLRRAGVNPMGTADALGLDFDLQNATSDFAKAVGNRSKATWADDARKAEISERTQRRMIYTNDYKLTNKLDRGYADAWSEELSKFWQDDLMQRVGAGGPKAGESALPGIDGIKDWLWNNQALRNDLDKLYRDRGADFADRAVSDGYVDSLVERWNAMTKGDPTLQDIFATGNLPSGVTAFSNGRPTHELVAHLNGLADNGGGPQLIKIRGSYLDRARKQQDTIVDHLFQALASTPTKRLSRSPTFRQAYWDEMSKLARAMDDESRNLLLKQAEKQIKPATRAAFHRDGTFEKLLKNVKTRAGTLSLEDADQVAKARALEYTKGLLYDTTKRSQWADTLRIISPFAEAWKEQITIGAKLLNPARDASNIRRAQQVIQGARGAGFFYKDPATGEEMFNYPMTGQLAEMFTGLNAPLRGRVQGLSLVGSVQPGLGPIMSIGMSALLPDTPELDTFSKFLMPFGESDLQKGALETAFLPSSWRAAWTAWQSDPQSDRVFGNFVGDVMATMAAKGGYGNGPAERERLYNDAIPKARILYMMRALGPLVAGMPASPSVDLKAETPEGVDVSVALMAKDFNKMQEENYETAPERFMDKYGEDAFMFMATKSTSTIGGQKASTAYGEWERRNDSLINTYPEVAGYFGPDVEGFDPAVYGRQMRQGRREGRGPKDRFDRGQSIVASFIYRQRRDSLPDNMSTEQRTWLRGWKDYLLEQYPGWNPEGFVNDQPKAMREVQALNESGQMADTPTGQALATYLQQRDVALEELKKRGLTADSASFSQAAGAEDLRAWLYAWGQHLTEQTPEFSRLWNELLAREVDDAAAEEPTSAEPQEVAP